MAYIVEEANRFGESTFIGPFPSREEVKAWCIKHIKSWGFEVVYDDGETLASYDPTPWCGEIPSRELHLTIIGMDEFIPELVPPN